MEFRNPANNFIIEASYPWLWSLFFGPFYFLSKGIWNHFLLSILLAPITLGLSWLFYSFFAGEIVRKHYLSGNWEEINKIDPLEEARLLSEKVNPQIRI